MFAAAQHRPPGDPKREKIGSLAKSIVWNQLGSHPLHPDRPDRGVHGGEQGVNPDRPGGSAAPESKEGSWRSWLSRTFTVGSPRILLISSSAVMVDGADPLKDVPQHRSPAWLLSPVASPCVWVQDLPSSPLVRQAKGPLRPEI